MNVPDTVQAPKSHRSTRAVVGFCTYNRAQRLPQLISALRGQECDEPFEILAIDNNSADETVHVLRRLAEMEGPHLRFVTETTQGIVPARNRLLTEAAGSEYLLMLDDDELPMPGWLQAGLTALRDEELDCVGGRVRVKFEPLPQPPWLGPELLGFLAEVDYGHEAFAINSSSTPIWTANVGYRTAIFQQDLRFDTRYNRIGKDVGGGEDMIMFERLLQLNHRLGYRPTMVVEHFVESWRLRKAYFLRLHFTSGIKAGMHATEISGRTLLGVPLYLFPQALRQGWRVLSALTRNEQHWLRQGMNFTHACGRIVGAFRLARLQHSN